MDTITRLFEGIARTRAIVVGDVMLDAYLWGRVDRISPEAPVPIVRITERSARLGGAANVALNMKALGATPIVMGVIGDDDNARRLVDLFNEAGLSTEGLIRSGLRTTTVKSRVISGHQHVVRVDEEMDTDLAAADEAALLQKVEALLAEGDVNVLVMEDYNKGNLTPAVIDGVIKAARSAKVPTAVDPKKQNFFSYRGVDLFKPNLKELREGLKIELAAGDKKALADAVVQLEEKLGNASTLITLSEHGVLAHRRNEMIHLPAETREIADVSGAGDTVIAVAAMCLAQGVSLRTLAALSNLAGGLVCQHVGVVPIDRDDLIAEARRLGIDA